MSNNAKIILSAFILVVVVSLLFLVVPITATFVVSYIFAIIAILGIAMSLYTFGRNITKPPQGYAFIYTAVTYSIIDVFFSIIACAFNLSAIWTVVVHVAILAIFIIRTLALTAGSEYINQTHNKAEEKHKEFVKEKESYWR